MFVCEKMPNNVVMLHFSIIHNVLVGWSEVPRPELGMYVIGDFWVDVYHNDFNNRTL